MTVLNVDLAKLHKAWDEIADSGFFTEGKYTRLFEEEVEQWSGMHAVAVNSCGSGLFALFRQLEPGDVVVPVNTFFATGAMAREAGHNVILADCGEGDFAVTLEEICKVITSKTRIVVLTHVGGWLAKDYEAISFYCSNRNIALIEDAAHVFGVKQSYKIGGLGMKLRKRTAGALGCAAVFSLYPTKAVPVGEGGIVVTSDAGLAKQLKEFRNYGKFRIGGPVLGYGTGRHSGFNLRMDEWTAAVAYLQTKRISDIMALRASAATKLQEVVDVFPGVPKEDNCWYKYPVEASFPAKRTTGKIYQQSDQLHAAMGISGVFPNALAIASQHICLPVEEGAYAGMSEDAIKQWLTEEV